MSFKNVLIFIFIFMVWYAIYQMFFSLIINIAFVLSIVTVIWLLRKLRRTKKSKPKLFLRNAT